MTYNFALDDHISYGNITALNGLSKVTISAWMALDGTSEAWGTWVGRSASNNGITIQRYSGGSSRQFYFKPMNGSDVHGRTSSEAANENFNHWLMCYDGTQSTNETRLRVWRNGTEQTLTYSGTIPATIGSPSVSFDISRSGTFRQVGKIATVGLWAGRAISDQQIINALADGGAPLLFPEDLLFYAPLIRDAIDVMGAGSPSITGSPTVVAHHRYIAPAAPLWVPAPAAGGPTYTLTAAYGSFTQTGQAAGLKASRLLTAAQGSYTLSGQDAGTRASRLLTAETGYLTQTGQASGLVASRLLAAAQGSYTLSGQAAALLVSRLLTAEQGSFTLSGQAAGLLVSRLLTAEQGTFTLSGQDAGLLISRLLTAAYGTFTITGQAADLVYTPIGGPTYTLVADQGSYTLSGQAAAMTAARLLAAAQGSYTMTGQDAGLLVSRILGADVGTYTITGQDASLLAARLLTAAQGSYTITGVAVTLSYSGEVIGAVVELADAAAFLVVITNAGAFVVELTDAVK